MTARWLLRVTEARPVVPSWQVMSLAVIHEGREVSETYAAYLRTTWAPLRVLTPTRTTTGCASHQQAVDLVGADVGTPTLGIGHSGFFGPVLTRCPDPDKAGEMWDAVVVLAGVPDFHELKRSRDRELDFS